MLGFGLFRLTGDRLAQLLQRGTNLGTRHADLPEQVRSDARGLGGNLTSFGNNLPAGLRAHLDAPVVRPRAITGHLDAALAQQRRPKHPTEAKPNGGSERGAIAAAIEVAAPLGMETLVFFRVNGSVLGPRARWYPHVDCGQPRQMHFIDEATGQVIQTGAILYAIRRRATRRSMG